MYRPIILAAPVVASKIATLLECCYPAPSLETSTAQQVDGPVRHFTEEQARKLWKSTVAMIENDMSMVSFVPIKRIVETYLHCIWSE